MDLLRDVCRRGTAFWSQKYRNYRRLDGTIQDTFLKNTGDLKGDFNDKLQEIFIEIQDNFQSSQNTGGNCHFTGNTGITGLRATPV